MYRSFAYAGLLLLLAPLFQSLAMGAGFQSPSITPEQLHDRQQAGDKLLVVDVRDPAEFRVGHLPGAVNLAASAIADHVQEIEGQDGVVVYCIAGTRTKQAEQTLIDHEIPNVFHLAGGLTGWLDSGFPVEKGAGRQSVSFGGK